MDSQLEHLSNRAGRSSSLSQSRVLSCLALVAWLCIWSLNVFCQADSADARQRLSREYAEQATSALASIHTWKGNMVDVIARHLPSGYYDRNLGVRAYESTSQSQIKAKTDGDHQAASLFDSYFKKVQAWGEKHKAARQTMDASGTMGENDVSDDPDLQTIDACEKALNAMLKKGVSGDAPSCQ
jgi:hypothetical protein